MENEPERKTELLFRKEKLDSEKEELKQVVENTERVPFTLWKAFRDSGAVCG